jgi:hypothetical protein
VTLETDHMGTTTTIIDGAKSLPWQGEGERDIILQTIGGTVPTAVTVEQTP